MGQGRAAADAGDRVAASPLWRSWRTKAALQRVFSAVPGGTRLNDAFQRHVTRSLPVPDAKLAARVDRARSHLDALAAVGVGPDDGPFFEFGAGWDLAMRLALHEPVDDVGRRLGTVQHDGRALVDHLARLGIIYRAPCDAASTGSHLVLR